MLDEMQNWSRGKYPWGRLLFLIWWVMILVRYLVETEYEPFLEMPLFVVHEIGHVLFGLSGNEFLGFA